MTRTLYYAGFACLAVGFIIMLKTGSVAGVAMLVAGIYSMATGAERRPVKVRR